LAPAHAQVARHVLHLGRTAAFKLRQRCASAAPVLEPTTKSAKEAPLFIGLRYRKHSSLHAGQAASGSCFSGHYIARCCILADTCNAVLRLLSIEPPQR